MRKKRIAAVVIMLCLIGLYGARVYAVNADISTPGRQVFEKGETVPYGTDYNISEGDSCEGYTVQALNSRILPAEEFCREYDVKNMGIADAFYMVKLSVKNESNQHVGEQGVPLGISMLVGTNYSIIPSPALFQTVNPDIPAMSFSLQTGTEKEVWLVFQLISGSTPDAEYLEEHPPMLQITQYPNQKLLQLS